MGIGNQMKFMLRYHLLLFFQKIFALRKKWGDWRRFWKIYYGYKKLALLSLQPQLEYLSPCLGDYGSVPIDDQNSTYFNAHRAFNEEYFMKLFDPLIIEEKRYIFGKMFTDIREAGFGIGCYHLRKVRR